MDLQSPQGIGNITTCGFRLRRDSTEYLVMFFTDIVLFYVIPLLLSVMLYLLIARILLTNSRTKFGGMSNGGGNSAMSVSDAAAKSNQSRVQVSLIVGSGGKWLVVIELLSRCGRGGV